MVPSHDFRLIVIGDEKSPEPWEYPDADYFSVDAQSQLGFRVAAHLPTNSYTRKMLGYLVAAESGASWIRETDDDNAPYSDFLEEPPSSLLCRTPETGNEWLNVYAFFSDRHVWPRGYPLSDLGRRNCEQDLPQMRRLPGPFLMQALANGDPDVDAIYRLTAPDTTDITFLPGEPVALPTGVWCPFNSQATTWPRELFALMYLPATCTFRMTDIWRSFVVQRMLPDLGANLVFTSATVHQDRNEHNLLSDFAQEVPGYLGTEQIRAVLDATPIKGGASNVLADLETLYRALIDAGFLTSDELPVLAAWLNDVRGLGLAS